MEPPDLEILDPPPDLEILDPPLYGRNRYRITGDEIIGVVKSNKCASFSSDVGAMVHTKCATDWESWRVIPEELKMHMIDELAVCVKLLVK